MADCLLGIDIGTSACKTTVFDEAGAVIAQKTEAYPIRQPAPGMAEQDATDWWGAAVIALKRLWNEDGVVPSRIAGIGPTSQSWAPVLLDKDGTPLAETPLWPDTRAEEICAEWRRDIGEEEIFALCGNPVQPGYTTPKLAWMKRHRPEAYAGAKTIVQGNGYIVYRLTGKLTQDLSQAYGYHCFDMRKGVWNERMCRSLGIHPSLLPTLVNCREVIGGVTAAAAEETGLKAGTPVVAGGLDAACGALGAGVVRPGQTQEQGGQAGGMSICLDRYKSDPRLILSFHVAPDSWLLQGGTVGGGGVMRWLDREFGFGEKNSMALLDESATAVPPGSEGLVFLPYMSGERSPIWNPHAKGVYYGLDYTKTKAHMIRAGLESVAYSLRHNLEVAERGGATVNELLSVGGAANSALWTQIKTDVTGKPIRVPTSDAATTLGAAILAGVGIGLYGDVKEGVRKTVRFTKKYTPNPENRPAYDTGYHAYLELYERLAPMMKEGIDR
jgi:xylulokinase